jgi:hypothetical protein
VQHSKIGWPGSGSGQTRIGAFRAYVSFHQLRTLSVAGAVPRAGCATRGLSAIALRERGVRIAAGRRNRVLPMP